MTADLNRTVITAAADAAALPLADFPRLDPGQEAGEECAVCWREAPEVLVGRNRFGEPKVRACGSPRPCAGQLGFRPEDGWQGGRA